MLREFFPNTEKAAQLYGGFLNGPSCFCKIFQIQSNLSESLFDINAFLSNQGYDIAEIDEFDETNSYDKFPVSISPHGYEDKLVLFIEKDSFAKPQFALLINELIKFRDAREWAQFHNPKDLAIALNIETSELLELFLWKKHDEADSHKIQDELADVFAYALLIADKYDLNIEQIVLEKIEKNNLKYPVIKSKGRADKYDKL